MIIVETNGEESFEHPQVEKGKIVETRFDP